MSRQVMAGRGISMLRVGQCPFRMDRSRGRGRGRLGKGGGGVCLEAAEVGVGDFAFGCWGGGAIQGTLRLDGFPRGLDGYSVVEIILRRLPFEWIRLFFLHTLVDYYHMRGPGNIGSECGMRNLMR